MDDSIYKIFLSLQTRENIVTDCFYAASLPFTNQHKIGISIDGFPLFFIECYVLSYNCYKSFSVVCQSRFATIVSLKTTNIDFQRYFIEVVCLMLKQMPNNPTQKQIKTEIQKLVELFSRFTQPPKKTIQGLWAELLIIDQAKKPEYLIQSWHSFSEDKFDFNDGHDKIEVKSTSQLRRVHHFAYEQLNPNKNSNLIIASVFVIQTGKGKSIFDLKESIFKKVTNLQLQLKLNEVIFQTLGNDFEKIFDVYYDYQQAIDTLEFYDGKDIPNIKKEQIPAEITNVHFDCDLSEISTLKNKEFNTSYSPLFKSISI